jgi:hypothetical protein
MPMPYTLTKGPLFTVMEQTLNDSNARTEVLGQLRNNGRLGDIPWVTTGDGGTVRIPGVLRDRLFRDWFGYTPNAQGDWNPQTAPFAGRSTGYWVGYYGNTEAVLREGLKRTIEVSLGLAKNAPVASSPAREWPIEVAWKCPNPWFEVWITWLEHGDGPTDGHVTMLVCTPPDTNNRILTEPDKPHPVPGVPPVPTPLQDPVQAVDPEGMWLVTHKKHRPTVGYQIISFPSGEVIGAETNGANALVPSPKGEWLVPVPSTFWVDSNNDDVMVVSPPAYAGGV